MLLKKYNASILQVSTSEIYGNPLVHPQIEAYWGNVNPIGIRAFMTKVNDVRRRYLLIMQMLIM